MRPHQVGGVGLEQAVADDDHAERAIQQRHVVRGNRQQQVAEREDHRADQSCVRRVPSTLSPIQPPIAGAA